MKKQGSKAGSKSKLYILLDVFFTVILWSRPATARGWAEKCTFAFNPHNISQTLTRPPWRYFSMHPGPVPMEKCQENFTTWICSFANRAKTIRCSICVCFRSLIQIFVFLFWVSHQNMSLEFIAILPRETVSLKARVTPAFKTFQQRQDEGQRLVLSCLFISTWKNTFSWKVVQMFWLQLL